MHHVSNQHIYTQWHHLQNMLVTTNHNKPPARKQHLNMKQKIHRTGDSNEGCSIMEMQEKMNGEIQNITINQTNGKT